MENTDYIFIQQWMTDLFRPKDKGKGIDYIKLMIFAYIYSYSRDGKSKWYGKQQTLANIIGCSEKAMYQKLKELVDEGLLIKEEIKLYGMFHHNNYWVNLENTAIYREYTTVYPENTNYKSNNNSDNISVSKDTEEGKPSSTPAYTLGEKEDYVYTGILKHIDNLGLSESVSILVKDWVEMIYKSKGIRIGAKQVDKNLGLIGIYPEEVQKQLISDATLRCHNSFTYVIADYEKKKSYSKGFKKNTNIPQNPSKEWVQQHSEI